MATVLIPTSASGTPNFGFKWKDQSCCVLRGTRSALHPTDSSYALPFGVVGLMRVAAGRSSQTAVGLIQIGYGKTNGVPLGPDCGGRSSLTAYWEYKKFTQGSNYHCAWLDGEPVVIEAPRVYKLIRRGESVTGNVNTWGAYIDQERELSINILFDGAEKIYAGGELNNCTSCGSLPDGSIHGRYGDSASTPWERTSSEGGSGDWVTITSANNTNTDGQWSIGSLPSPFGVHHSN